MKKALTLFISALCILFATSCEKEPTGRGNGEGLPVRSLSIKISIPSEEVDVKTKATDPYNDIESLSIILVPENQDSTAKFFGAEDLGTPEISGTSKTYKVKFDLTEQIVTGGRYYLFAMANAGSINDIKEVFGSLKKDEIAAFPIEFNEDIIHSDLTDPYFPEILMTGSYCEGASNNGLITLKGEDPETGTDGSNQLTGSIRLRRITARIHFDFKNASGVSFTPESYSIHKVPFFTTIFERDGWNGSDPGSINTDGNLGNIGIRFEDGTVPDGLDLNIYYKNLGETGITAENGEFDFMMPENVQHSIGRPAEYKDREAHVSAADQSFLNAPANATYVVVRGKYEDSKYEGNVSYTIHLGDFSTGDYSNFSVRRNYKYNYHITINGVKNIVTECESVSFYEPQPGAEGHLVAGSMGEDIYFGPGEECQTISTDRSLLDGCKIFVSTPDSNGIKEDGGDSLDDRSLEAYCNWLSFRKPYEETAGADIIEDDAETGSIYDFLLDVQAGTGKYYTTLADGKISFTVICQDGYILHEDAPAANSLATKAVQCEILDERSLTLAKGKKVSLDGMSSVSEELAFSITQGLTYERKAN